MFFENLMLVVALAGKKISSERKPFWPKLAQA